MKVKQKKQATEKSNAKSLKTMLTGIFVLLGVVICLAIGITGVIAVKSISNDAYNKYETAKDEGYRAEIKSQVQSVLTILEAEEHKVETVS